MQILAFLLFFKVNMDWNLFIATSTRLTKGGVN
jgi:hypothetical protein